MIFLIEYHRGEGQIITLREFEDSQRQEAENARLDLELNLNRQGIEHEVVLLEAASKEALLRTHQRYFADFADLANLLRAAGKQRD